MKLSNKKILLNLLQFLNQQTMAKNLIMNHYKSQFKFEKYIKHSYQKLIKIISKSENIKKIFLFLSFQKKNRIFLLYQKI